MKLKLIFSVLALFGLTVFGPEAIAAQTDESGNTTDLQFLDMMMHHHTDGVKMAQMGVDKGQNEGVKALAGKMADDQQKETGELQKMRDAHFRGQPKQEMMMIKKREMTKQMMEKMSAEDMRKLEAAGGAEFDRVFLDVFVKHHQMGIDMAQEEVSRGSDAEVKKQAREIISKQTKDIAEIRRLKNRIGTARAGK